MKRNVYFIVLAIMFFSIYSSRCNKNGTEPESNSNSETTPLDGRGGGLIAFVSQRNGGDHDIFVMNGDGSDATPLTANDASDFSPDWSPDGAQIAFESDRDGDRDIYVMDAHGENVICLTPNSPSVDLQPDWSPDGSRILFN